MPRNAKPRPAVAPSAVTRSAKGWADTATILRVADPVPASILVPETVEDIARRSEVDDANNRWWYQFGWQAGRADALAEAKAFIERIRLDREAVARLQPTGESCPSCGYALYRRRPK